VIVIEYEDPRVWGILFPTDSPVSRAQVAIWIVCRPGLVSKMSFLSKPGPVLTMSRDHHPLFPQRVPPLFEGHLHKTLRISQKLSSFRHLPSLKQHVRPRKTGQTVVEFVNTFNEFCYSTQAGAEEPLPIQHAVPAMPRARK
jgi:hypothetical protein